jgi:hypothetical protein
MPANPRPALRTIVKAAEIARAYGECVTVPGRPAGSPDPEHVLLWLNKLAKAARRLPPTVKALRPKAPWSAVGILEHVDPLRPGFLDSGFVEDLMRKEVPALGKAAAQIVAQLDKKGLATIAVAPPAVYQFKVTVTGIAPPIWRRLLISNQVTLRRLHMAIQIVGGWWNYHLHVFEIAGSEYGYPDPLGELQFLSDAHFKLNALGLTPGTSFRYLYDFGDHWEHEVLLEEMLPLEEAPAYPVCLGGERGFPHEDCGSVPGYYEMLRVLQQPRHPEHEEMRTWAGPHYDPESFDLDFINRQLRTGRHIVRM